MSYEGNDLGYDSGYDLETRAPAKSPQQNFSSESNLPPGYRMMADAAVAFDPNKTYVAHDPASAKDDKPSGELLGLKPDGTIEKYPDEAAMKDKATPVQVQVVGKSDNKGSTYLVRYQDNAGNPIKYDEVDGPTAKKLGIDGDQLTKAPTIGKGSTFEKNLGDLRNVEKSKTKTAENPKTADLPTYSLGDFKNDDPWKAGDQEKGVFPGKMYKRLKDDYGFDDAQVKALEKQYKNSDDLDAKFPPVTDAEKNDKTKLSNHRTEIQNKAANDMVDTQAHTLYTKLNDGKNGITEDDCKAMVRQKYREGGVSFGKPADIGRMGNEREGVDGWINGKDVPEKPADGAENKAIAPTYQKALVAEKDQTVDALTPLMPGKNNDEKKANARLYLADQKDMDRPGAVAAFRDDVMKQNSTEEGKRVFKDKVTLWTKGFEGPDGQKRKADLAVKAGKDEKVDAVINEMVKGLPKDKADQVKANIAQAKGMAVLEDEKRVKDFDNWVKQRDYEEVKTKEKEKRDEAKELRMKKVDKQTQQELAAQNTWSQIGSNAINMYGQQTSQGTLEQLRAGIAMWTKGVDQSYAALSEAMRGLMTALWGGGTGKR